jgi:hypothetical protein
MLRRSNPYAQADDDVGVHRQPAGDCDLRLTQQQAPAWQFMTPKPTTNVMFAASQYVCSQSMQAIRTQASTIHLLALFVHRPLRCRVIISIIRSAMVPGGKKPMYLPAPSIR